MIFIGIFSCWNVKEAAMIAKPLNQCQRACHAPRDRVGFPRSLQAVPVGNPQPRRTVMKRLALVVLGLVIATPLFAQEAAAPPPAPAPPPRQGRPPPASTPP